MGTTITTTTFGPELFRWKSIPAAAIFAFLYIPLFLFFMDKIIREQRKPVLFLLSFFCLTQVLAFILRSVSIGVTSIGGKDGVTILTEVLFSFGFCELLFSAYTLIMDRLELYDNAYQTIPIIGNILHHVRSRALVFFLLTIALILSITSISVNITEWTPDVAFGFGSFHIASVVFFVTPTILLALQTLVLIRAERQNTTPLNNSHVSLLFGIIALLLLIREVFTLVTINDFSRMQNEHFWYPFIAVPSWLCAAMHTIPGVIPRPQGY